MSKKLTLSAEEFARMERVVSRLMAARKQLPEGDWKKGINPIIKDLAKKFTEGSAASGLEQQVFLKRPHLRFLEASIKEALDAINNKVIPEYEKRGPADKKDEYIAKAKAMAEVYSSLLTKVEAAL